MQAFAIQIISAVLLMTLNIMAGMILSKAKSFDLRLAEICAAHEKTREKLDEHCENFKMHGLVPGIYSRKDNG